MISGTSKRVRFDAMFRDPKTRVLLMRSLFEPKTGLLVQSCGSVEGLGRVIEVLGGIGFAILVIGSISGWGLCRDLGDPKKGPF